jgi:hypothetical protein
VLEQQLMMGDYNYHSRAEMVALDGKRHVAALRIAKRQCLMAQRATDAGKRQVTSKWVRALAD